MKSIIIIAAILLTGCARYSTREQDLAARDEAVAKCQARAVTAERELAWWRMRRDLAAWEYANTWGYLATTNMATNIRLEHEAFDKFIADERALWALEDPAGYLEYFHDTNTNQGTK